MANPSEDKSRRPLRSLANLLGIYALGKSEIIREGNIIKGVFSGEGWAHDVPGHGFMFTERQQTDFPHFDPLAIDANGKILDLAMMVPEELHGKKVRFNIVMHIVQIEEDPKT